jgi:urocanate hydratase
MSRTIRAPRGSQLRQDDPAEYTRRSMTSMAQHVEAMLAFQRRGAEVFDYGNNLRQRAFDALAYNKRLTTLDLFRPTFARCFVRARDPSVG